MAALYVLTECIYGPNEPAVTNRAIAVDGQGEDTSSPAYEPGKLLRAELHLQAMGPYAPDGLDISQLIYERRAPVWASSRSSWGTLS